MEVNKENCKTLKCKTSTDANKLAGSIHSTYLDNSEVPIIIRVIGAGALNQAIKAIIISNKYFVKNGIVVGLRPSFCDVENNVTAIDLRVIFSRG